MSSTLPPPANSLPTVHLDGQENDRLTPLIAALEIHEHSAGLAALELRLDNVASLTSGSSEFAFDAGADLNLGGGISVACGPVDAPVEVFTGFITGLEGIFGKTTPQLVVLAEDALQKARLRQRSRTIEQGTLADLVREVASNLGLTPQVSGLDQNFGPQVQMNESDLAFLRRLLARVDADLHVIGRELHAAPRQSIHRGEVELILGDNLTKARILADLAHQTTKATARGWDIANGSAVTADGAENALGPGAGDKGGPLLERTLGARTHHTGHLALATQAEAAALADTVRNHRARRFLRIIGEADGDPRLRAGSHVRVSGVGRWFTNTFFVTSARHIFDRIDGYRVEFEGECAFLGRAGA